MSAVCAGVAAQQSPQQMQQQMQQQQQQQDRPTSAAPPTLSSPTRPTISNADDPAGTGRQLQQGGTRPTIVNRRSSGQPEIAEENGGAPLPPLREEQRSEFQEFVAASVGRLLPVFGHNLFEMAPSTFAPVDRVPVTSDYMIGPGDEIVIRAWGQVDIDYRAIVDRNGAIHIPQIGSLTVGGLKYQDLHGYMRSAISRVFRNFDLNVNLGQLRSIQIFVVGQARFPGSYTVSSLTTLVNALFASGGPSIKGSMRNIQLKRGDKVVTTFDVYDLLLNGDKSKDVRLIPGDVIYIPPVGEVVAIAGSINQPAIYELKAGTTVGEVIQLAGGLSTVAAGQKAKLESIADRRTRLVDEFDLDRTGLARQVRNGDVIQIYALSPRFENAVSVRGFVANPGRFPWREGMRVRDVVPDRESLIVPDYWERLNRATRWGGVPPPRGETRAPAPSEPGVTLDSRSAAGTDPRIVAEQRAASEQRILDMRMSDPQRLGDPRPSAVPGRAPDTRVGELQRLGEPRQIVAQPMDARSEPRTDRPRVDMRRLFDEINWDYAVIERLNPSDLSTVIVPFNLGRAVLEGDPAHNLVLRPGDIVTVFSRLDVQVPVAKQSQFVRLEGEVRTPGVYQIVPGETLRQLVTRVGGFTPNAYLYASEFSRESVRLLQQARLDEAISRFAAEIETAAIGRAQAATDEKENLQAQIEMQRRLIERLRSLRATGRVVLEVNPERTDLRDLPEMPLEDGDRFLVPPRPSTVAVMGSVYNQSAFVHHPGKRLTDYLDMAGGFTRGADKSRTYVVRADGTVTGRAQSSFFNVFPSEKLNPGDTVVVPENLERFILTKQLRDWSQILSQFALGVAALKVLRDF